MRPTLKPFALHAWLLHLALSTMLAACGLFRGSNRPTPSPIPSMATAVVRPTQGPYELYRVAGEGSPFVSQPIRLATDATLRINWNQSGQGKFILSLANRDPALQSTPYGRVIFELSVGPSNGSGEYSFVAGEYVLQVEEADGAWEVWVEWAEVD